MNSEPPLLIFQRSLNQWFLKAAEIGATAKVSEVRIIGRPRRWHSRLVGATSGPVSGRTAGGGTKIKKCTAFSNVLTCAVGRSSVRVVPHTAGMKFQGAQPLWLYSYCNRENFGFLEEISHN